MEQVIQNKIFNAKSEIAEVQARMDKWMGDDFRFNGLRDRIHFGLMIAATIITFIVSLFVADGILYAFLNAGIAFGASFMVVGAFLMTVDDSFHSDNTRYHLFEARKALIEGTLDARVHEGVYILLELGLSLLLSMRMFSRRLWCVLLSVVRLRLWRQRVLRMFDSGEVSGEIA